MEWIDITHPLRTGMPVWPGDTPFSYQLGMVKAENGVVNVGELHLSTHTGTHIDAPFHFDDEGKRVHQLDLSLYMGPVYVLHVPDVAMIGPEHLQTLARGNYRRVIIRTDSWKDPDQFPKEYTAIDPAVAPVLKEMGVELLGLDTPSVDPVDSKVLEAHHALHQLGVHILESAVLTGVDEGMYELIALPLHIAGGDGSPVRAVLRKV